MREVYDYAERFSTDEAEVLARLNRETHLTQVYPQMLSGHLQGLMLQMFVHMVRPRRVLEIGTFTGYSAIAMALAGMEEAGFHAVGQDDGFVLHTIEVNPEFEAGIRRYIAEAGLEGVIRLHTGNALEIIPQIRETWDMVFIDADKSNYLNYYKLVLPVVRPGGFILADNVLWDGKVLGDPEKMDKDTRGIVEFNEFVKGDPRVEQVLLPVRDGVMVVRKVFSNIDSSSI
jgi:predicted O-methyltransferase YrrM